MRMWFILVVVLAGAVLTIATSHVKGKRRWVILGCVFSMLVPSVVLTILDYLERQKSQHVIATAGELIPPAPSKGPVVILGSILYAYGALPVPVRIQLDEDKQILVDALIRGSNGLFLIHQVMTGTTIPTL